VLQAGRSRVRFPMVSLEFFIDIILQDARYGPGVDSAANRNEYQECVFPGVDSASNRNEYQECLFPGVRRADNLTNFMCRLS
jgi:hypothetical protein